MAILRFRKLTRAQFDALDVHDLNTRYTVEEPDSTLVDYIGDRPVLSGDGAVKSQQIEDLELETARLDEEVIRVGQQVDAHLEDLDNPHEVTAEQVDTYVKTTIDNKDADTLQAAKDYTYNQVQIDNKDTAIMNKANNLENANMFKDVNYNNVNGVLTFTKYDDTTKAIDLPLELLVDSGYYDEATNELVLVLANSSEIRIPVGNLLTDLDAHNIRFNGSGTNYLVNKTDVEDAVKELDTQVKDNADNKVDKVNGKGLSTEDYTTAEKNKLDGIETGAEVNPSAAVIKSQYESNADTNAFTDDEKGKLEGIEAGAQVNEVNSVNGKVGAVVITAEDIGALPGGTPLFSGDYDNLSNKPTIDQLLGNLSTLGFVKRTGTNTYEIDTSNYQPLDGDLTAIAGLSGTSGFLKKTSSNTWSLDTSVYLTAITKTQVETVLTGTITTHTHNASAIVEDASHRFVADTEKNTWNNKVDKVAGKGLSTEDYTTTEKNKLGGIQAGAQVNPSASAIKTQYESNANTNAFTDTEKSKLSGIQAGAQVNPSASAIKTQYESNADTNALTNALKSKLEGIQAGAQVNPTAAVIKSQYESNSNTNAFTDGEKSKLASLESSKFVGQYTSLSQLQVAHPTALVGSYAFVDPGSGSDVIKYIWDSNDTKWVLSGEVNQEITAAQVKVLYEDNADTNAFTDAEKSKLSGVEAGAQVNPSASAIKTQYESNSNTNAFTDTEKSKLSGIAAGAQVNVKPDWNAASGNAAEVLNKPTIDALLGGLFSLGFVKRSGANTYIIDTSTYQPLDDDLTAIAGLSGTSGFLKKTGSNTWSLETSVYLTEITKIQVEAVLTGTITTHTHNASDIVEDASHRFVTDTEKTTWNNKVDKNTNITGATKTKITYDSKGLVTAGADLVPADIPTLPASKITQTASARFVTDTEKSTWNNKVDKVAGKGLSTEDYTTTEKNKLAGIASGAQVNVQSDWAQEVDTADDYIKNKPAIPTKISDLTNDTGYVTDYIETDPIFTAWDKSTGISITKSQVSDLIEATQLLSGLMSATDKQRLDVLHALLEEDTENDVVDSINEILAIFQNYPEGADLLTALAGKVDKVPGKGLSTNDLTNTLKSNYDTAYSWGDHTAEGYLKAITKAMVEAVLTGTITTHTHNPAQINTNASNRFVTDTEKTTWNNKQNKLTAGDNITIVGDTISASGVDPNSMAYFDYAGSFYGVKYGLLAAAWEHSLVVDPLEISVDSSTSTPKKGTAQYPNGETEGVIIPQGVTSIGEGAFGWWSSNNQPLVIPNSVTSIGEGAFAGWSSNNQPLVIPNSVTSIGVAVFAGWSSNNQPLVIPNSVTSIGEAAFAGWSSNNQPLVIPNSVTSIGDSAFSNWELVPYVEMQSTTPPTLVDAFAFVGQNNAPIYVPDESVATYKAASNWADLASRIISINDKMNEDAPSVDLNEMSYFDYAGSIYGGKYSLLASAWESSLTVNRSEISENSTQGNPRGTAQYPNGQTEGVIIPQGVTSIGDNAFYQWPPYNQPLVIPSSVISIGSGAFAFWYSNNQPIVIPNSVTTIGDNAFQNWPANNQPLTIPRGVTSIGDYAFAHWTSNNHPLIIPNSVTNIGAEAFQYWTDNEHPLVIPGSVTNIKAGAFQYWTKNNHPLTLPSSLKTIGNQAFYLWPENRQVLNIPYGVTSIGSEAFANWANNNQPLVIPATVTSIGTGAFEDWYTNNQPLTISNGVTSIGGNAFANWPENNQPLVIPGSVTSIGAGAFQGWGSVPYVEMQRATPPTLANADAFSGQNDVPIYVPDESVATYKAASNWTDLADRIFSINDKVIEDADDLDAGPYYNYAGSIYGAKYSLLASAWEHSLTVDPLEISVDSTIGNLRGIAQYPDGETEGVIIPQGVTSIGEYAFRDWTSNNQPLVIPNSVINIGNSAFREWDSNNQPLVIPQGVTTIASQAFFNWSENKHPIVIPDSVTIIGTQAFMGWLSVPYIEMQSETPPTLQGSNAFWEQNDAPIYVPHASVATYKAATAWMSLADRIFSIKDKDKTIEDAPNDDKLYGRKNNTWEEVQVEGGSGGGGEVDLNAILYYNYAGSVYGAKHSLLAAAWESSLEVDPLEISVNGQSWETRGKAQYPNGLTEGVIIPQGITSIGDNAFRGWTSNNQPLVIPNTVTIIRSGAFWNWTSNNQPLVIPDSVTSIGVSAFRNWSSNNQPLVIPQGVTTIGNGAFTSWLQNNHPLVIPDSVTSIDGYAFYDWPLVPYVEMKRITPPTLVDAIAFGNQNNAPIYVPDASVAAYKAATNWAALSSRIFPVSDKDKTIEDAPNDDKLYGRKNNTWEEVQVEGGEGGGGEVDLNEMSYFDYAGSIYGGKYSLLASAWESSLAVNPLEISATSTYENPRGLGQYPDNETEGIIIPHGVTSIGENAFYNNDWKENDQPLVIPSSVTSIGNDAFVNWHMNNHPLVIPNSVTSIGDGVFFGWSSNNHPLVIPNNVTSIGNSTFHSWTSNNHPLVIPNSVTSIDGWAFANWYSNNHPLVIPNSVTSIGYGAFNGWYDVLYVEVQAITPPTLVDAAAFDSQNDAPIYVPDASVNDYKTATNWAALAARIFPVSDKDKMLEDAHDISFNGSDTNYLTAETEVDGALKELDTQVKTNADNVALKQDKLVAGNNITIDPDTNVISASGDIGGTVDWQDVENKPELQDKLVAGDNITIDPDTNVISASGVGGGEVDLNEMSYFDYAGSIYGAKYSLLASAWEHSLTVDPLEISANGSSSNTKGTAQYPDGETEGVIIPQGVTSIGEYAFYQWPSNNQPLVIPSSVTSIGDFAFLYWASNNHQLVIPDGVTSIGMYAFNYWASNKQPLVIPNSVTSIGNNAFTFWSLNNHPLVIPANVTSIGSEAFANWTLVPYVEMKSETPPTLVNANAFANQNDAPIYVPDWTVNDYKTATNWEALADRIFPISDKDKMIEDAHDISFNGSGTNYLTAKTEVEGALKELDTQVKANVDGKQDKLVAGDNITIDPDTNVISASGGGGGGGGSTLPTITQLEIDAGTSTTPVAITPKLLRDNFYTESEIDNMIGDIENALDAILGV